jgi:hypothetical protein
VWTLIIPGVLAYYQEMFFMHQMIKRLPAHASISAKKYQSYEITKKHLSNSVAKVDSLINRSMVNPSALVELNNLLDLRKEYRNELQSLAEPVSFRPFYENRVPYYWLINYFSLMLLVFVVAPVSYKAISGRKVVVIALVLHFVYSSFNYLRNFVFFDEGRIVFSYAHFDISPLGFLLQEIQFFGMCTLVAVVWVQWEKYFDRTKVYTDDWKANSKTTLISLSNSSRYLYSMFLQWQISSIFLSGGFLIWTFHFWNLTFQAGDSRYNISAIVMHLFWLLSWIIISRPFVLVYTRWSSLKVNMQAMISEELPLSHNSEEALHFLDNLNPLNAYQLLGTSVAAIGSFLFPFFDLLRRI